MTSLLATLGRDNSVACLRIWQFTLTANGTGDVDESDLGLWRLAWLTPSAQWACAPQEVLDAILKTVRSDEALPKQLRQ